MNYIIFLGAFQALIVLGLLSAGNKNRSSDGILRWLLMCMFVHLGVNFFLNTVFPNAEIHKQFNTFITLFYTPLLWMYAARLGAPEHQVKTVYLFLPGIIAAIAYFMIAGYIITHHGKTPETIWYYNQVTNYAIILSYIIYPIKTLQVARKIPDFWKTEKHLVRFIAALFLTISAIFLLMLYKAYFPSPLADLDGHLWARTLCYIALLTACLAIGRVKVLSLMYTHIEISLSPSAHIVIPPAEQVDTTDEITQTITRRKQALSDTQQARIAADMNQIMKDKKPYLEPELTLDGLAKQMSISRHHLSETLNQYLAKSFYQYVNEYRVKEVTDMMKHYTEKGVVPNILSLAFDAGFHSKSSFNQYFKKTVGHTPSAYLKNLPSADAPTTGDLILQS
ncbi:helix-turn-helix domain-containing protein [Chitinophaga pendula]|uniref:AraC family transcriptional regulator n=1 Tax=Chitinophaga TaxID=79328 RepID=UPI000BB0C164|nr:MULTISPECIES: helix-turn-helix domain-containing protein [Chitinophaga]ASZ10271.1 hypothetical protein CK934_04380 [Chitinophaga sp. MD30]UCJ06769.1 helix-turn-helix domain-containing protein [Chitinophaga pendula]